MMFHYNTNYHAKVKWFDVEKGFGFLIIRDLRYNFCHEVYVATHNIMDSYLLQKNDCVVCTVAPARKHNQAMDISQGRSVFNSRLRATAVWGGSGAIISRPTDVCKDSQSVMYYLYPPPPPPPPQGDEESRDRETPASGVFLESLVRTPSESHSKLEETIGEEDSQQGEVEDDDEVEAEDDEVEDDETEDDEVEDDEVEDDEVEDEDDELQRLIKEKKGTVEFEAKMAKLGPLKRLWARQGIPPWMLEVIRSIKAKGDKSQSLALIWLEQLSNEYRRCRELSTYNEMSEVTRQRLADDTAEFRESILTDRKKDEVRQYGQSLVFTCRRLTDDTAEFCASILTDRETDELSVVDEFHSSFFSGLTDVISEKFREYLPTSDP